MEIKYTECPKPKKAPCLMENEFGEVFLVTRGESDSERYVTKINCGPEDMVTWKSDVSKEHYKPLPKGTKVEFIN